MNQDTALEILFSAVNSYMRQPVKYAKVREPSIVRIYFNNEYPLDLPLEVVKFLWPNAEEDDE